MPNNEDYYSEFTGSELDSLLKKARDAENYARRAERALEGVEEIAGMANEMLKAIAINTDSIGMQKINLLPIEDEHVKEGETVRFEEDAETGAVSMTPMDDDISHYYDYDERYGDDPDTEDYLPLTVELPAGKYYFTKSITSNRNYGNQAVVSTKILVDDVEVTGPAFSLTETAEVEIQIWIKVFHGHFRDYDIYINVFPFLRREIVGNVPFEPYKPDLQTQINELREMIENMGGYNETQVEIVSDNVTEVTV